MFNKIWIINEHQLCDFRIFIKVIVHCQTYWKMEWFSFVFIFTTCVSLMRKSLKWNNITSKKTQWWIYNSRSRVKNQRRLTSNWIWHDNTWICYSIRTWKPFSNKFKGVSFWRDENSQSQKQNTHQFRVLNCDMM